MDARELTQKMYEQQNITNNHEKRIEYLEQELAKLRMLMDDMKIDLKMMQGRK